MISATSMSMTMLLVIFSLFNMASADTQSFIPLSRNGHAFHRGNTSALTTVEYFIDLTCSACRDSWPVLNEVYNTYKEKVHFEYRVFPLPYHQQGFIVAKAAQVVNVFGSDADSVFKFIDIAYDQQPAIYNAATADMTYNQVVDLVATWATDGTGATTENYYTGMNSSTTIGSQCEMNARYAWKYIAIQGVFATPMFQIDGLKVGGLDTLDDWKSVLNPLVA